MTGHREAERHLPLAPHAFQILLSLLEQERHGYSIIKEVEERTQGQTILGTSTVYAAIGRMVEDGLLAETQGPSGEASGGPRRRYYRVTEFGRTVARLEGLRIARLHEMVTRTALLGEAGTSRKGEVTS